MKRLAIAIALFAVLSASACRRRAVEPRDVTPWVWHRSEDLRGIDPSYGLAVLLLSIELNQSLLTMQPRVQALQSDTAPRTIGVVRIDVQRGAVPSDEHREEMAKRISVLPERFALHGIQIDLDATVSQRQFYGDRASVRSQQNASRYSFIHNGSGVVVRGRSLDSRLADLGSSAHAVRDGSGRTSCARPARARRRLHVRYLPPQCRAVYSGAGVSDPGKTSVFLFAPPGWTKESIAVADRVRRVCETDL
jgi:hypothetical protein